jgi:hypothetical protein
MLACHGHAGTAALAATDHPAPTHAAVEPAREQQR